MTIAHENVIAHSKEILIRKFEGDVFIEDIINSWEELISSGKLTEKHRGVVNHLGKCNLMLNPASFNTLMNYLKSNPMLRKLKLAVVCDESKNIVFPIMAEEEEQALIVRAFTTLDAALNWVER